jgi:hypothetical protein
MATFAFSIEKATPWRGQTQGFSNVYHYNLPTDEPSEQVLDEMLTYLKNAEQPVHASNVNFVVARCWGPVNPDGSGGRMRVVKQLSGTGTQTPPTGWYKELAFLIKFPLGRYGEKNRPQFLRKWIRANADLGISASAKDGHTPIPTTPTVITTYINAIRSIPQGTNGPPTSLTAPSGDHSADQGSLYQYLEHRQYGR